MAEVDLASLSILIVEDETLLRKQLAAELERLRADVTGVGTQATTRLCARTVPWSRTVKRTSAAQQAARRAGTMK